jgi:hypothetical protein
VQDGSELQVEFQKYDLKIQGENLKALRVAFVRGVIQKLRPSTKEHEFSHGENSIYIASIEVEKHDPLKPKK